MKILAFLSNNSNPLPTPSSSLAPLSPILSFPDSSIVKNGNPVFLPDFDSRFAGRFYLAVKISRLGKSIAERFASRYYTEVAPVMNITAENLLSALSEQGLPWTAATGFDRSLAVGKFIEYSNLLSIGEFKISYSNGEEYMAEIPSSEAIAKAIAMASRYNSLKMGDLILIPLSDICIDLKIDSLITISADEETLLKMPIK